RGRSGASAIELRFGVDGDLQRARGAATMTTQPKPNADEVCRSLRDFQRATVEYAYRRLYLDPDRVDRFLVADEVGLGKTWVAKGVIAKAVAHLFQPVESWGVERPCLRVASHAFAAPVVRPQRAEGQLHFLHAGHVPRLWHKQRRAARTGGAADVWDLR